MDPTMVEQVREFNRTVTQRIGALNDAFLSRDRPLGQARLLWEIGLDEARGDGDIRSLRSRLDLDSGYVSRLLRSLEADGLIVVEPSPTDGRVRVARLTRAGRAERAVLDRRSEELAGSILRPLSQDQRARLVSAMAEVNRLLVASTVDISVQDPRRPAARACLAAYVAELAERLDQGFDPARSLPAGDDELTTPRGLFLVATRHGEPVGCAGLKFHGRRPAEVKRMWVAPSVRGLGLGRRLLAEVERHAVEAGVRTLRLETNKSLTEALSLYRAAGYQEVPAFNHEPYADHWFTKRLPRRR
jgi:DNA-binding MarR family transcriptional regulator/GNAT superfamily N-acetyltransferase